MTIRFVLEFFCKITKNHCKLTEWQLMECLRRQPLSEFSSWPQFGRCDGFCLCTPPHRSLIDKKIAGEWSSISSDANKHVHICRGHVQSQSLYLPSPIFSIFKKSSILISSIYDTGTVHRITSLQFLRQMSFYPIYATPCDKPNWLRANVTELMIILFEQPKCNRI